MTQYNMQEEEEKKRETKLPETSLDTSLNFSNPCTWRNIEVLTLSNCDISFLPKELGILPYLRCVNLSDNNLSNSKWIWLEQATIQKNLTHLDISYDCLNELPLQVGRLHNLTVLNASNNRLTNLPQSIGILQSLECLNVSCNKLLFLPGTITCSKIMHLEIDMNPFASDEYFFSDLRPEITVSIQMPTLVEWSAKIFLTSRIPYDASSIPRTLVKYLDEAKYCCVCKRACFNCYIQKYKQMVIFNLVNREPTNVQYVQLKCCFCSRTCFEYFFRHSDNVER